MPRTQLPQQGIPAQDVFKEMRSRKEADADWHGGRTFSLIYPASAEVDAVLEEANRLYMFENALNPFKFPSLRDMEGDVVQMTAGLLNAPESAGGSMTSGGTESIIMAVKVAAERGKAEHGIDRGAVLAPESAHPAFAKACHFLELDHVQIPLRDDFTADPDAAASVLADTPNAVLMVGSAPGYPHGVVDPIQELAALAQERAIAFHTDSCVGGFLLPFVERLGREVPPFDFRVPGVTSMSADVHKYGYCTKGASVVLHRESQWMSHQVFLYDRWPGGMYGSPAIAGARPAAPIAAAWAVMRYLGIDGYTDLVRTVLGVADSIRAYVDESADLHVWGDPIATVLAVGSDTVDVMAVGDVLDDKGWNLDRQTGPAALHMMLSPGHARIVDELIADIDAAVADHGDSRGKEIRYS